MQKTITATVFSDKKKQIKIQLPNSQQAGRKTTLHVYAAVWM